MQGGQAILAAAAGAAARGRATLQLTAPPASIPAATALPPSPPPRSAIGALTASMTDGATNGTAPEVRAACVCASTTLASTPAASPAARVSSGQRRSLISTAWLCLRSSACASRASMRARAEASRATRPPSQSRRTRSTPTAASAACGRGLRRNGRDESRCRDSHARKQRTIATRRRPSNPDKRRPGGRERANGVGSGVPAQPASLTPARCRRAG